MDFGKCHATLDPCLAPGAGSCFQAFAPLALTSAPGARGPGVRDAMRSARALASRALSARFG